MSSYQSANELQDYSMLKHYRYKAYIPRSFVTVSGVIAGVPVDMTIDEIEDNISSDVPILSINRLHRYEGKEKLETHKIGITFRANKLPSHVRIFCCINRVSPFVSKPVLCFNCLRYNHRADNCRSKKRCMNCTQQHEEVDGNICSFKTKCLYCKTESEHRTVDTTCPEWNRQRNIKTIMAKTTLSYMEAKEQNPILTQNRYEALECPEEFPTIQESYASMAAGNYKLKEGFRYKTQQAKRSIQEVSAAEKVTIPADKKKKNDGEQDGVALYNKHSVSDYERFAQQFSKQRTDIPPANNDGFKKTADNVFNTRTIKKKMITTSGEVR